MLGTNHILENSQKLSPRVVQPPGASMLTSGWVRTIRTAQNLHNADIQWAERGVEADFVHPKLCIPGRLNQKCGHGASIRIVCDGSRTSVGSPRRFDDIAPAHRRTPKCAVGRRSRSGLIVRSGRSTSFGRSPRLVPRSGRSSRAAEGVEAVGRGQPFATCTARRRRPFTAPKVDMLGSGGCSGWSPILAHISFDAAARERLAQWRHCPARPLYLKLVGIKIASVFDKIEISKQLSSPPRSQAPRC